jgi:hypothetical protein
VRLRRLGGAAAGLGASSAAGGASSPPPPSALVVVGLRPRRLGEAPEAAPASNAGAAVVRGRPGFCLSSLSLPAARCCSISGSVSTSDRNTPVVMQGKVRASQAGSNPPDRRLVNRPRCNNPNPPRQHNSCQNVFSSPQSPHPVQLRSFAAALCAWVRRFQQGRRLWPTPAA